MTDAANTPARTIQPIALFEPGGTRCVRNWPSITPAGIAWRAMNEKPGHGRYVLALVYNTTGKRPDQSPYEWGAVAWRDRTDFNFGDEAAEYLDSMSDETAKAKGYEILRKPRDECEDDEIGEDGKTPAWGVMYEGWCFAEAGMTEDGETAVSPLPEYSLTVIAWAEPPAIMPTMQFPHDAAWQRADGFYPAKLVGLFSTPTGGAGRDGSPTHLVKRSDGTVALARLQRLIDGGEGAYEPGQLAAALFLADGTDAQVLHHARRLIGEGMRDFYLFDSDFVIDLDTHPDFGWAGLAGPSAAECDALRALYRPDLPAWLPSNRNNHSVEAHRYALCDAIERLCRAVGDYDPEDDEDGKYPTPEQRLAWTRLDRLLALLADIETGRDLEREVKQLIDGFTSHIAGIDPEDDANECAQTTSEYRAAITARMIL